MRASWMVVLPLEEGEGSGSGHLLRKGKRKHKHKHRIVFSDVVFKNRWSDVNSADLISLKCKSRSERVGSGGRVLVAAAGGQRLHVRRVSRMEWSLLTSGLGRRHPSPPRSGRDGKVRRDSNRCSIFKKVGRIELSKALLDQGRSCCGRFDVPAWCSSRSRREDVARSGGNAAPCMDCAFFVKGNANDALALVALSERVRSLRFCVSQAPVCARGLSRCSGTVEVLSSSWTPSLSGRVVVRLRERRQWDSDL
ncbi:hypothetical protein Taro_042210 [Colocasia esculenta]|uniref:Uncharacterized protein n=1 Tax=Colocasia esculenta TaxID=4460 RepID=A0A843WZ36_COLES|nr:hypothetical protein [Colocasia esculenta]